MKIINGNILAEMSDYFSEPPPIIPCEDDNCVFEEKQEGPVTWRECIKCKQQIILEIRI